MIINGALTGSIHNGSAWVVRRVKIKLTPYEPDENARWGVREYSFDADIRPLASERFSCPLNAKRIPGGTWDIVDVYGQPDVN